MGVFLCVCVFGRVDRTERGGDRLFGSMKTLNSNTFVSYRVGQEMV